MANEQLGAVKLPEALRHAVDKELALFEFSALTVSDAQAIQRNAEWIAEAAYRAGQQARKGCINCGAVDRGGYMTGFEGHVDEGAVGPFCAECWELAGEFFRAGQPEWQPIETAPKDTDLLLFGPFVPTGGVYMDIGRWTHFGGGFWDWSGDDSQPTHWMPLPAVPAVPPAGEQE